MFPPINGRNSRSMSPTTLLTSTTFSSSNCLRLKASNRRVSVAARSAACWIECTLSCSGPSLSNSSSNTSVYPLITISRLLKSCATPPASLPTASIFCAWRSCSSSCRRSVMSSAISSSTSSGSSLNVAAQPLSRTMITRPSLRFHCTSTPFKLPVRGIPPPQPVQFLGTHKNIPPHIQCQQIFHRSISQHGDERRIHIQKPSAERAPANAKRRAQNQRPRTRFRPPQRFFIALVLDRGRQLLRNKFQNLAIPFSEARVLAVALHHQRSNAVRAALQRNPQPVDRRSSNQLHFTPPHQLRKNCRRRQQRLARSQHIFRQTAPQSLRYGRRILFIHKIRKAQQLRLRIVERNVKVPRIHQLPDNIVNRRKKLLQILR